MNQTEIQSWIDNGYLHIRAIIQILGSPKEHAEKTLREYIENMCKSEYLKVIEQEFAPAEAQEQDMWSTFAEVEFMIKGVSKLVGFCFDYMPASIEVLAPERITFTQHTTTEFINDLQAKLHRMDAVLKNQDMENQFLRKNMNLSIQNLIAITLYNKKLNPQELSKVTGVSEEGLQPYLDALMKDNKIKKEEDKYCLA